MSTWSTNKQLSEEELYELIWTELLDRLSSNKINPKEYSCSETL